MKIKNLINLITFLTTFLTLVAAYAQIPSPCNAKLEAKRRALVKDCESRLHKSTLAWKSLETAQNSVIDALKKSDAGALEAYIGCDATNSTKYNVLCESDAPIIARKHIENIMKKINLATKSLLNNVKWVNYGFNKELYLMCTSEFKDNGRRNSCGDVRFQPIIEIKKSGNDFYISGVPF